MYAYMYCNKALTIHLSTSMTCVYITSQVAALINNFHRELGTHAIAKTKLSDEVEFVTKPHVKVANWQGAEVA